MVYTKVRVNGQIATDPDQVLEAWVNHFKDTSRSRAEEKPSVAEAISELPNLVSESYANLETVLDYPFTFEEVEGAIHRLKARKAGGADKIQPEHIKFGGQKLVMWLLNIYNSIVELEDIPHSMKIGTICPVYSAHNKRDVGRGYACYYCCMPSSPVLHIYCTCFSTFWHCHPYILQHFSGNVFTPLFHWFFVV